MGINYNKIKETIKETIQLEQKLENDEEQYEAIPIASMSAKEVLSKINSVGYVYNIEGGLTALQKLAEKEKETNKKKGMKEDNADESRL